MRFSARLRWDLKPNPLSERLAARRAAGGEVLDLTESNPTHAGFEYPAEEILGALGDARAMRYEPSAAGSMEARRAVSAYYAERGSTVEPERILLTASTSEAYAYLLKLLADPGDEILVPQPSYPLLEFLAGMEQVCVRPYPLVDEHGWRVDLDALERAIGARTRAIVVVNPNNPTGSYLKREELARLDALCAARGVPLISDEVFADYALSPDPARAGSVAGLRGALMFSLSGLSKIAALPQMKLGWIAVSGSDDECRQVMERLELIADTYLSVGTPVQIALPRLLAVSGRVQAQILERLRANLTCLRTRAAESPCRVLNVEGGWYAILEMPRIRGEEDWVLELLDRDSVLVQPGFFYDFPREAFLVVSLLTEPAVFSDGMERLLRRSQS